MRPFDYKAAKAGAPVCTRAGHPARIICWDRDGGKFPSPIVYLSRTPAGFEHPICVDNRGRYTNEFIHNMDLVMADRMMSEEYVLLGFPEYQDLLERDEYEKYSYYCGDDDVYFVDKQWWKEQCKAMEKESNQ